MTVALELGKSLDEMNNMSLDEFGKWLGYFEAVRRREKRNKGKGK